MLMEALETAGADMGLKPELARLLVHGPLRLIVIPHGYSLMDPVEIVTRTVSSTVRIAQRPSPVFILRSLSPVMMPTTW